MKVMLDPMLPDHWKVKKLAGLLYAGSKVAKSAAWAAALGHIAGLWCRVMARRQTGNLRDWPGAEVADAGLWTGNSRKFIRALLTCRIIEKTAEGYVVHEWVEHQGDVVEERERERVRKAAWRAKNGSGGAVVPRDKRDGPAPPSPPLPSLSLPIPPGGSGDGDSPLVSVFGFCGTPGQKAKADAIADLRRQGVTEAEIRASAEDPERRQWDFYAHVRALTPKRDQQPIVKSPF